MSEVTDLRSALVALEGQREVLGNAAVDAAAGAIRQRLEELTGASPGAAGEWKQVTILFADISGFTALSELSTAEEVRNIVNDCFERMGAVVARYGGYIDKFIGDELMVLFGAPRALEDHASRALYAALEIRDAIAQFNQDEAVLREKPLGVHMGINSGLVVAGAIGTQDRRDYTVMGDAVNVAARLVARAREGDVLVGESTGHLGGHDFEFDHLGEVQLEGHKPVVASLLLRARHSVPLRGGVSMRAAMLGRDREIAALKDAFTHVARKRERRSVAILGPAGIGKSRLQVEFRAWLQATHPDVPVLIGTCFPHMGSTPYFVFTDILQRWLGISHADSSTTVRERLETSLAGLGITEPEIVHALGAVLAVEYADDQLRDLLPEERRQRILASLLTLCERMTASGPMVVLVEDIHWADELSLDILDLLARQNAAANLLVVLARPSSDPEAEARQLETRLANAGYDRMDLKELDPAVTADLVAALTPGLDRGSDVAAEIVAKGQGNPFFLEAIVGTLFDQGALAEDEQGNVLHHHRATLRVPDTVWAVLAERLDRLPPAERGVVQRASVVGQVFWEGLVGELAGYEAGAPLDRLHNRELVDPHGMSPFGADWEWLFRHALVRDVAYSSLLAETRKSVHLQVARWLHGLAGDRLGEYVTLLAHHYLLGEGWEEAVKFAELAGDRASDLFAYSEARASYMQALEALDHLGSAVPTRRRRVELTLKLAAASYFTPSAELYNALQTADAIALEMGDTESHIKVQVGIASWQYIAGQAPAAVQTATRTIGEATEAGFESLVSIPYSLLGRALYVIGEYGRAGDALERSRSLAESTTGDPLARYHVMANLAYLGMVREVQGAYDEGLSLQMEALRLATQREDRRQIALARVYLGANASILGNVKKALEHLKVAAEITEDLGDPVALYCTLGFLGFAHAQNNDVAQAQPLLERALKLAAEIGSSVFLTWLQAYRWDVEIRAGRPAQALEPLRATIELGVKTQQRQGKADAHRILAWALHYTDPDNHIEAEAELRAAIQIHRECASPVALSRTLFELAGFLRATGDEAGAAGAENEARSIADSLQLYWLPATPPAPLATTNPAADTGEDGQGALSSGARTNR